MFWNYFLFAVIGALAGCLITDYHNRNLPPGMARFKLSWASLGSALVGIAVRAAIYYIFER